MNLIVAFVLFAMVELLLRCWDHTPPDEPFRVEAFLMLIFLYGAGLFFAADTALKVL